MASFLQENQGLGRIQEAHDYAQRKQIVDTWRGMDFLKGIPENSLQEQNIAQLFENTARVLIESTDTGSSGSFETIAFPLVRRVFQSLLANEIVTVYALNYPVGRLFFYVPKISQRDSNGRHSAVQGAFSNQPAWTGATPSTIVANQVVPFEERNLYDAFYATDYDEFDEGLFDRSKPNFATITGPVVSVTGGTVVGSNPIVSVYVTGFSLNNRGKLVGPSGVEADTEEFMKSLKFIYNGTTNLTSASNDYTLANGSTVRSRLVLPAYGDAIVDEVGRVQFQLDLRGPAIGGGYSALTNSAAVNLSSITYEYRSYFPNELDAEMAEVTFDISDVTVAVGDARKLRAQWTPEVAMDVQRFQGIDAEAELTNLLSETVATEIDMEILRDLNKIAAWTDNFDREGYTRFGANSYFGTQKDWYQFLFEKLNQIDGQIYKSTLDQGDSWIVCSVEVASLIMNLEYFHGTNAETGKKKFSAGIERVGTLGNRFTVYQNAYFPAGLVLVGRKGDNVMKSGYVYCPYQPVTMTPTLVDQRNFTSVKGLITRYAKKVILPRYYGKLYVDSLKTFPQTELR